MLVFALVVVVAYLLGSLSGSLLLGRWRGVDIRTRGSGNAGGTNALRTMGWRFALGVLLIDIGKGALAAWMGLQWHDSAAAFTARQQAYVAALAAAAGHCWPLWFGFRGGKGAGTIAGALLVLWPLVVPLLLAIWLFAIALGGYVGLATLVAAGSLCAASIALPGGDAARHLFALAAAALVVFTHRGNVRRLLAGSEHRFEHARVLMRWRERP